nr:GTP-binding protein [Methylomonas koyamae]
MNAMLNSSADSFDHGAESTARPTGLLRFITAGSVDDGKSTLIGRLLHDTGNVAADQLASIRATSQKRGLAAIDWSLLTDGLIAEREQGITIDVAYRYFATARRKFIIGDAPGHEQYTRNMVTAASGADLAILLVDARKASLPKPVATPIWHIYSVSASWCWQ